MIKICNTSILLTAIYSHKSKKLTHAKTLTFLKMKLISVSLNFVTAIYSEILVLLDFAKRFQNCYHDENDFYISGVAM